MHLARKVKLSNLSCKLPVSLVLFSPHPQHLNIFAHQINESHYIFGDSEIDKKFWGELMAYFPFSTICVFDVKLKNTVARMWRLYETGIGLTTGFIRHSYSYT
jgi:hypothetical protein